MNEMREIKCEACPRVCPEDYQKMVEHCSRACQERDTAQALLRREQERTAQWISVKDRLPDTCGLPCLLCGENAFGQIRVFAGFTGYMERGKFEWHSNQKDIDIDVWTITHWMPLPEPPEAALKGGEG